MRRPRRGRSGTTLPAPAVTLSSALDERRVSTPPTRPQKRYGSQSTLRSRKCTLSSSTGNGSRGTGTFSCTTEEVVSEPIKACSHSFLSTVQPRMTPLPPYSSFGFKHEPLAVAQHELGEVDHLVTVGRVPFAHLARPRHVLRDRRGAAAACTGARSGRPIGARGSSSCAAASRAGCSPRSRRPRRTPSAAAARPRASRAAPTAGPAGRRRRSACLSRAAGRRGTSRSSGAQMSVFTPLSVKARWNIWNSVSVGRPVQSTIAIVPTLRPCARLIAVSCLLAARSGRARYFLRNARIAGSRSKISPARRCRPSRRVTRRCTRRSG